MIGYPISRAGLRQKVEAHKPGWLTRAEERTAQFLLQGTYTESSSIWSEIKAVYMVIQGGEKCVYCERKLESEPFGKSEQAVEHFRPKGNVAPWKLPPALAAEGVAVTNPPAKQGGYFVLPYDLFNYAASCNPCNSALKRDHFPIAGAYNLDGASPETLLAEQPLLLYPIGDFDSDPESLIRFHGLSPQAVTANGHDRHRALVTIEFFQLDSPTRNNLIRERIIVIIALCPALEKLRGRPKKADKRLAMEIVDGLTASQSAHANCARSYRRLFEKDRPEALEVFQLAATLLATKS